MNWKKYEDNAISWNIDHVNMMLTKRNQINHFRLKPQICITKASGEQIWENEHSDKKAKLIEYVLSAEKYNPAAELARVYELVLMQVATANRSRDMADAYIQMVAEVMHIETKNSPMTEFKRIHNIDNGIILVETLNWINKWGIITDTAIGRREMECKDYLLIAKRFYDYYAHRGKLNSRELKEINHGIQSNCNVGIFRDDMLQTETDFGFQPKNILGFLWITLGKDLGTPTLFKRCKRELCGRIFGSQLMKDNLFCSINCTNSEADDLSSMSMNSIFDRKN
ncbi:MAG: hypothetical protein QMB22_03840 [Dehalococcoidia bacterium]|jgi:hypothetical protein|nr:MAG: hypothetical protein DK305_000580 [Chloroflexota bacterium]|tara:strand:+ start:149 stop:994 length:846 start_codon:yes stop_codon:yes gene_type:complete